MNISTNKKGIVLLNVIIMLLTIALIGASLVAFLSLVNISAQVTVEEIKAFYLAEAGISQAVSILKSGSEEESSSLSFGTSTRRVGPIALGDGTYTIEIDINQGLISSIGQVGDTKKSLQLQYSML
ncbi:MAG: hypothetical protein ABH869_04510 [Candidatus Omnitrophota bacterium]